MLQLEAEFLPQENLSFAFRALPLIEWLSKVTALLVAVSHICKIHTITATPQFVFN